MQSEAMKAVHAAIACDHIQLENGLTVLVRPMPQFSGVHAIYGTRFGSVDLEFSVDGEHIRLPAGVAHFLEHKMFESEDGDAFAKFAQTGANANAYTSFDKTCYLFTATQQVDESLDILLSMVNEPYFTQQTIQKEQGIIGQEIKMYDDSPDWRMITALFGCLYHNHPIRNDIAGTVESIAQITPDMLYACCRAFYNPGNMVLAVAGNVTTQQVLEACSRAKLPAKPAQVKRILPQEPNTVARQRMEFSMQLAKPCLGIGFKEVPMESAKAEVICDMLTELICGGMTEFYRTLYDEGLVNPGFGGEFMMLEGCCCFLFTGETSQPERVRSMLLERIGELRQNGVDEEIFTLCKNQTYGEMLQNLENIEDTATALASSFFHQRSLNEEIEALASVTKQEVDHALQTMLDPQRSSTVIIWPKEETEE
ncbi:EF-P 5-aminopentanol modification-associated protein YfmH [uncultured Allofournierella sp.]|uniref:EF-P 5-aminopentanol modification-associated protein YfmH n=1 Tax=uncultured Allofournierella sp. TaxID=1940258 RepID=UPI003753616D